MNLEIQFKYSIFIGLLFAIVTTGNEMSIGPFDVGEIREPCIKLQDFNNYYQSKVIIKYNNHVFDQIIARIYRIFVRDVLGFQNVILKEIEYNIPEEYDNNTNGYRPDDELLKTFNSIFDINESDSSIGVVNLAVWIPPNYHRLGEYVMTGESYAMGRFGWFVPKNLNKSGDLSEFLPYTIFSNPLDNSYQQFIIDKVILDRIYRFTERCGIPVSQCIYVPDHCNNVKGGCVTLLAPSFKDTSFIIEHINEYHLYVQVMWFDHRLQIVINSLYKHYMENSLTTNSGQLKRFVVLHWHPSEITVNPNIEFEQITMPHCEEMNTKDNTLCKYELMPIVSLYNSKIISNKNLDLIRNSLRYMQFEHLDNLFYAYHNATAKRNNPISLDDNIKRDMVSQNGIDYDILINGDADIYEKISCDWVTENVDKIRNWTNIKPKARKPVVRIGGIFPLGDSMYSGLTIAVDMAIYAINMNETLLPNIDLGLIPRDVECRADAVLREVINYLAYSYNNYLLGILGPACSETVEPIAGLSKHLSIPVISYSAEGANFMDRQRYPYFFRTIGENRQYEHVYLKLFEQLDWHRVAALTEDGQKYTEYISHMETELKRHNIELIANKKFPKDVKRSEMQENLEDLKRKNARIIIADINDEMAQIVMCEAYKLQMTAKEGYVWFLPVWLSKNMTNNTCTVNQLKEALAGHFSLGHASFAEPTAVMQENRTVAEWKTAYFSKLCEESDGKKCYNESLLDYGGFAYDAIWVYAIALNRLLEGKKYSIEKLLTPGMTKAFTEIIDEIDFNGVSGRIRFGDGGSRFSTIHVYQWYNESLNIVGSFIPNVSDAANSRYRKLIGGTLELNVSNIRWPDKIIPNDGREVCGVEGLADLLNTSCPNATYILVILLCSITVIIISIASFMFWKHLYDRKLKQSLNKNFIDLLQPLSSQSNTLDKWEVSKDRVVINRRLGEGAFGTVYGGEAQIIDTEWTAVAVKTLKTGSNEEDRVNFLAEAEAMKRFDHKNILKLLGVCLQSEPLFTIMEFMLYGDLKTYLLARRHLVGEKLTEDSDISPKRLTMMALDIARALAYLADMKYVHRDVACRNCLVNTHRIVKLGDFGMTRAMFENDYYKFSRKGMLPVRWMAPESLGMGIFTPASDVWSYGVCIYEIITFGSFPFQGLTNNQVLEHIKNGKILTIPNGVKPPLEALLNGCWSRPNYKKRPSAADIVEYLSGYPRLITPCLDVPLASVQLAETDSDQMELLPGLRKRINGSQQPLNGIIQTVDGYTNPPNGIILSNFKQFQEANIENFNRDTAACNNKTTNSDYNEGSTGNEYNEGGQMNGLTFYNPIEPLLKRDDLYGSNSSMKRYVPMCGIRKNKSFNAQSVDCNGFNNSIL